MRGSFSKVLGVLSILLFAFSIAEAAAPGSVKLPVNGTFKGGGIFSGTATINRFENRGDEIWAVGFVTGVLSRGNKTIGNIVAGEFAWPVSLSSRASSHGALSAAKITPSQETCEVLQIGLGPIDVNLLGFSVSLGAITFDIVGEVGTPLGDLVCSIVALLGTVADVVDLVVGLLNTLLGLLTGLLGGLGGIGA